MNNWQNAVLTNKGKALLAKLVAGNTLTITKAEAGAGTVDVSLLPSQTAVSIPKQTLTTRAVTYPELDEAAVPVYLENDDVNTGYTAMQIGLYAQDPDEGEILYFIAQANEGTGTVVPSKDEMPGYTAEWTFYFTYGQADDVTVIVDPNHGLSYEEGKAMIEEAIEGISASDITQGVLGVSQGGTGNSSVDTTPVSGSTKMVTSGGVYESLNNINASQIKAGVLPVSRGGTGNNSIDTTPTSGSTKMVTSGGVYAALNNINASQITAGILPVARGGTGNSSVDTTPTSGSTKMVTSGGVYTALAGKADSSHNHSASNITTGVLAVARGGTGYGSVDTTPTSQSAKMVTSGGVYTALQGKANTSHNHSAGNITSGVLPVARGGTGNSSVDTTPTSGSTKMVTSGGVYTALGDKQKKITSGTAAPSGGSNGDIYIRY